MQGESDTKLSAKERRLELFNYKMGPVDPVRCAGPTDKVAIVGFSETTNHLAPYDDPSYEIWGLNEEYIIRKLQTKDGLPRWDRWFQIHQRWDFTRHGNGNDPRHFEWLKAQRSVDEGGFPIYMQARWDDIPASVPLDLDALIAYSQGGTDGKGAYYTNTVAILIAQAVIWGFKRIELYGIEMAYGTEWAYQKPCTEYHIGMARAKGVEVYLPPSCNITRGKIYAWEVGRMISRHEMESRLNLLVKTENESIANLNLMLGKKASLRKELMDKGEDPMKSEEYVKTVEMEMQAYAQANAVSGAKQEAERWIRVLDNRYQPGEDPNAETPTSAIYRIKSKPVKVLES